MVRPLFLVALVAPLLAQPTPSPSAAMTTIADQATGPRSPALERKIEEFKASSKELVLTHFFMDGRGMHGIPFSAAAIKQYGPKAAKPKPGAKPDPAWAPPEADATAPKVVGPPVDPAAGAGGSSIPPQYIALLRDSIGLNFYEGNPIGYVPLKVNNEDIGVITCMACHTGRAAGQFWPGLGNKRIDMAAMGQAMLDYSKLYIDKVNAGNAKIAAGRAKVAKVKRLMAQGSAIANKLDELGLDVPAEIIRAKIRAVRRRIPHIPAPIQRPDKVLTDDAIRLARVMTDPPTRNLTQGVVSVDLIHGWFDLDKGESGRLPVVKVPPLWGLTTKRTVGLFCDGIGDGTELGWFAATELAVGQKPETVRKYLPQLQTWAERADSILPPIYPFHLDKNALIAGYEVYEKSCKGCHGDYHRDEIGLPVLEPPKFTPLGEVGTDPDRARMVTPAFRDQIAQSPLADVMKATNHPQGYLAPRLEGIWARFPYLHNGSVPTLHALLTPSERPAVFSLWRAGERDRFDETKIGLTVPAAGSPEATQLEQLGSKGERSVYDTRRPGHGNRGHDFGSNLSPEEKRQLIEFLKTL